MNGLGQICLGFGFSALAGASEFRHFGDFLLQSHCKLTGTQMKMIPIKQLAFRVFTDGVDIQVKVEGSDEACSTFRIYSSDGIGRQRKGPGAIEVIPGVQALSDAGGTMRHLRLTQESMTITTFPGISDQTTISYSVAAERKPSSPDMPLTTPEPLPDAAPDTSP